MSIVVDRLLKTYDEHVVVNQVSLEVADGECFVLLGPSGSGKSTVLRIVAGLTPADAGRVLLHGKDVTHVAPQRRGVGMVFQQYALFGHMTVADNVEFPLRIRKVGRQQRARRRDELLELVGLVGFQRRFPHQLSGGQQQRVALARALAHEPEVLLLDEPFGALDARIRADLRKTLRRIQREVRVTTIFVTHDQEEAFELADRLGIVDFGRLLEVGPPHELYLRPQTEFVATFLGRANLFVGRCTADEVHLGEARFALESRAPGDEAARRVQVLFRPEDVAVKLTRDALEWPTFGEGIVEEAEFSGSVERLRLRIPAIPGVRPIAPAVPFGADHMLLDSTRSQHLARRFPLCVGDRAWVGVRRIHALAHPGLSFIAVDRGTAVDHDALRYAGLISRLCHARVTLLGSPDAARVQAARESLGGGLAALETRALDPGDGESLLRELDLRPQDMVIAPMAILDDEVGLEALIAAGQHHVLLVPGTAESPRRVLLCTAAGEPAKHDVLAAGRIVRHLGASVTILTAVPAPEADLTEQIARFHDASVRTLAMFGIESASRIVEGPPVEVIAGAIRELDCDLVVLGSPQPAPGGSAAVRGLFRQLARETSVPMMIVRPGDGV